LNSKFLGADTQSTQPRPIQPTVSSLFQQGENDMKRMFYTLMTACVLALPLTAVAQSNDNMKQDQSQQDQMKHDDMSQDQSRKDDMKKDKKSKAKKNKMKKDDSMKHDDMKHDDMKNDDGMKQN
jgi:pentapeptide MXKDX repeat protein